MGVTPLTREDAQRAADAWERNGQNAAAAARELGLSRSTIQYQLKRASHWGMCGYAPVPPGFEVASISHGPNGVHTKMRPEGSAASIPEGLVLKGASVLSRNGTEVIRWDKYGTDRDLSDQTLADTVRAAMVGLPVMYDAFPLYARAKTY